MKFGFLLLMMVVGAFLEMAGIGMIPAFIGITIYPDKVLEYPVIGEMLESLHLTTPRSLLLFGSVALLGVFAVKNSFRVLNFALLARFTHMRNYSLSTRLLQGYLARPYHWFLNRHSADLGKKVLSEVQQGMY